MEWEPPLFAYGTLTLFGSSFQRPSAKVRFVTPRPSGRLGYPSLQPHLHIGLPPTQRTWFGLFPVRSPLLGESRLIYVLRGT